MTENDRLLTETETFAAVQAFVDVDEDWATRTIRLNRGRWEDIAPIIAQAQDAKTLRAVGERLRAELGGYLTGDRWETVPPSVHDTLNELVTSLLRGEMPGDELKETP